MVTPVELEVADQIRRRGPLRFDEVMDRALYDPVDGFFGGGSGAGRRADFLTSPEVGPLFGALVDRARSPGPVHGDRGRSRLGRTGPVGAGGRARVPGRADLRARRALRGVA